MNNNLTLKVEAGAFFFASLFFYYIFDFSWWMFAALILLPDAGLIGYLKDNKTGALVYNLFHTKTSPILLFAIGCLLSFPLILVISHIWFIHINFDRMVGIGLKEPEGFKFTHLGKIG